MARYIDPDCSTCHGKGEVISNEKIDADGGYWCSYATCHCVEWHHTPEQKAAIARALSLSSTESLGDK